MALADGISLWKLFLEKKRNSLSQKTTEKGHPYVDAWGKGEDCLPQMCWASLALLSGGLQLWIPYQRRGGSLPVPQELPSKCFSLRSFWGSLPKQQDTQHGGHLWGGCLAGRQKWEDLLFGWMWVAHPNCLIWHKVQNLGWVKQREGLTNGELSTFPQSKELEICAVLQLWD